MNNSTTMHEPPHPGEFISETFLIPLGLSARELSVRLGVTPSTLHRVLVGSSNVSPEMAIRLSKVLGRTPESWLALQNNYSLWHALRERDFSELQPIPLDKAS